MTVFQKNQKLNIESADGIWLDYKDHHWIFFLKDRVWDKEELQRVNKSDIHISFIQKGIVDAFCLRSMTAWKQVISHSALKMEMIHCLLL